MDVTRRKDSMYRQTTYRINNLLLQIWQHWWKVLLHFFYWTLRAELPPRFQSSAQNSFKSLRLCCHSSTFHNTHTHTHTLPFSCCFLQTLLFHSNLFCVPCWKAFNHLNLNHWNLRGGDCADMCCALMSGEKRSRIIIISFYFLVCRWVLEEGNGVSLKVVLLLGEHLSPAFIPDGAECDCALFMWGICQTQCWNCIRTGKGSDCHFWGRNPLEEHLRR